MKKNCILGVILGISLLLSACSKQDDFDAMGIFESDEILVSSEISGKIVSFNIKEGDELSKGQNLGFIDDTQIKLNQNKLKEQINVLNAQKIDIQKQIAPLEEELKTAQREQLRMQNLRKQNATTQKSLDDANSNLDLLKAQKESKLSTMSLNNEAIEAQIKQSLVEIEILEDNLKKSKIISPINGVVLEKYAFEGELSSPNKALFKIADVKTLRLKAYIIDTDLSRVRLGDEVSVFSDYGEAYKEYKGKISFISSKAEFTPKTIMSKDERKNLVYAIKIDVENSDGLLKIGSYGEVKLNIAK